MQTTLEPTTEQISTDLITRTIRISTDAWARLEPKLEKLARRATRNKLPAISWNTGPVLTRTDEETGEVFAFYDLTVTGPTPRIEGWSFVATLEHLDNRLTMVRAVPGMTEEGELTDYRAQAAWCDHCQKHRIRKDTYILRHDAGGYKQVGSNCLRDFLGHSSPEMLAEWAELLAEMEATASEEGLGHHSEHFIGARFYLGYVTMTVRLRGWVSRTKAREELKYATCDRAMDEITNAQKCSRVRRCDHMHEHPSEEDQARADAALAWVKGLAENPYSLNDYQFNLVAALDRDGALSLRHLGIAASVITAHQRELERQVARDLAEKQRERERQTSTHQGEIGGKLTVKATITNQFQLEGDWGVTTKYIMRDDAGNVFTWRTNSVTMETGQQYTLKGTVKAHTDYKGIAQTELTRAKILAPAPKAVW